MNAHRKAKLFRNGRSQAVRIPKEFQLPGNDVVIHKDGERLIIEPAEDRGKSMRALLDDWRHEAPLGVKDDFPEIDDPPPEPVADFDD